MVLYCCIYSSICFLPRCGATSRNAIPTPILLQRTAAAEVATTLVFLFGCSVCYVLFFNFSKTRYCRSVFGRRDRLQTLSSRSFYYNTVYISIYRACCWATMNTGIPTATLPQWQRLSLQHRCTLRSSDLLLFYRCPRCGLVGYPRACKNQFCDFNSHRVHILVGTFSCIKIEG